MHETREELNAIHDEEAVTEAGRRWWAEWQALTDELVKDEERRDLGAIPEDPETRRRRCGLEAIRRIARRDATLRPAANDPLTEKAPWQAGKQ